MKPLLQRLDHFVITTPRVKALAEFYQEALDMDLVKEGDNQERYALKFGFQTIKLHPQGTEYKPHSAAPTPGALDFCLITPRPLSKIEERLRRHNIPIEEGPVARKGAMGSMKSIYFRDLDQNLVEIAAYDNPLLTDPLYKKVKENWWRASLSTIIGGALGITLGLYFNLLFVTTSLCFVIGAGLLSWIFAKKSLSQYH